MRLPSDTFSSSIAGFCRLHTNQGQKRWSWLQHNAGTTPTPSLTDHATGTTEFSVPVYINGVASSEAVDFFLSSPPTNESYQFGGLTISDGLNGYFNNMVIAQDGYQGAAIQLFSGTVTNPTFQTGTYTLSDNSQWWGGAEYSDDYTLDISQTPIPGALLLFGPGLAGLVALRKRFKG